MSAKPTVDPPTTFFDLPLEMQGNIFKQLSKADQTNFSKGTYTQHHHIEKHQEPNAIETIVIAELLRWALHIFLKETAKDKNVQKGVFDISFGLSSGNSIEDDPDMDESWKESLHFTFRQKPGTIDISFWAFIPEYPTQQKINGDTIGYPHKWFPTYKMIDELILDSKKENLTITATYEGDKVTGIKGLDKIFGLNFNPPYYEQWYAEYKNVIDDKEAKIGTPGVSHLYSNRTIRLVHDLASQLNITRDMYKSGLANQPLLVYQAPLTVVVPVVPVVPGAPVVPVVPVVPVASVATLPIGLVYITLFDKKVLNYTASINLLRKGNSVPRNVSNACVIFLLHIYNQVNSFASSNEYRPKYKDLNNLTVTPLPKDKYGHLGDLIANNNGLLLAGCTFLYNFSKQSRVLVIDNNDKTLFWLEEPEPSQPPEQSQGGGKLKKPSNGKIHVRKEPIQGYNRAIYKLVGKGNTLFVDIKGICKRYTDVK